VSISYTIFGDETNKKRPSERRPFVARRRFELLTSGL